MVIQLVDFRQQPLQIENVFVTLSLYTHGNYRYGFKFGPTDTKGSLCITYEDVERERAMAAQDCIMDYNTALAECDNGVRVGIPTGEELRKAFDVATGWAGRNETPEYAVGWLTAQNSRITSKGVTVKLENSETHVFVPCEPL